MIFETERFVVEVGVCGEDKEPQYLVKNKAYGVVEFCNSSLYFVRDWSLQMTKALDEQDEELKNPTEVETPANVLKFPGGGNDRTN